MLEIIDDFYHEKACLGKGKQNREGFEESGNEIEKEPPKGPVSIILDRSLN
jgi:hypothetical protein